MAAVTTSAQLTVEEQLAERLKKRREEIRLKLLSIIEGAGREGCYINDLCLVVSCFDVCYVLSALLRQKIIKYHDVDRVRMGFPAK